MSLNLPTNAAAKKAATAKKVAIIGGGFSGLTLAWALSKKNIAVEVFESGSVAGGMLSSEQREVLVESAANAFLASFNVELLLKDIEVTPIAAGYKSKSRWIFRSGKPQKFPLGFFEALKGLRNIIIAKFTGNLTAKSGETLASWGKRVLSDKFVNYLISPAFQGVYGTTSENLSAELIMNPLLDKSLKPKRGVLKGSISANNGMGEILKSLSLYLKNKNINLNLNSKMNLQSALSDFNSVVVATPITVASEQLKLLAPKASSLLETVPMLPLTTATAVFNSTRPIKGFGCLFPADQGFNSLGVLFNSDIFENRAAEKIESETWILPVVNNSENEIKKFIEADRLKMTGQNSEPQEVYIKQWPKALPLYGSELLSVLQSDEFINGLKQGHRLTEVSQPVYLTGNYLGAIGLARILDYNLRLAERIEKELQ